MVESNPAPEILVGVAASAGGIEAAASLFRAVPPDLRAAFILVLHLDPTHASHLAEILRPHAPHLEIAQAEGTRRLEPNCVYVIAPNSKLRIAEGMLEATPLAENETRGHLADHLFSSLAELEGVHAAGVVLSGGGADGTEGLRRLQAAGGLTIAQQPGTAGSPSMPQSAIDAGVVALVLAPEEIPAALLEFRGADLVPAPSPEQGRDGLRQRAGGAKVAHGFQGVLEQLGAAFELDFSDYKLGTLERRTRRRMDLRGIQPWDEYRDYLAAHPIELDALYRDLLIGVTGFFRDPETWDRFAAELPALFERQRPSGSLRAWVAGCATGEEAYTVAMLLIESASSGSSFKIQLYGTDINERALATARRGVYASEAVAQVPESLRDEFFAPRGEHHQIVRRVRDCVTLAPHNVLSDPPFSRMDVVSCRNLLIYLTPEAHDRVLQRLHFALREGGLLVLGQSEALGRQTDLFEAVSKSSGIYRALPAPEHAHIHVAPRAAGRSRRAAPLPATEAAPASNGSGAARRIEQYVLRERTPACVVVDTDLRIRHFYGRTRPFLTPPTGEARQDLLAWIRPGFHIRLRSALARAVESGQPVTSRGRIHRGGEVQRVDCVVEPLASAIGAQELFLVSFQDAPEPPHEAIVATYPQEPLLRELEQELRDTQRELQRTIEELESTAEEHDAGQEELQSLNEELQSGNEELTASKEELEALNEEVTTINRELEEKNIELRTVNDDLANLFSSTGVPTIFLDRALRIRRFTEAANEVLCAVPSDVGRSIEHIKQRFDAEDTAEKCRSVLDTLQPAADEVTVGQDRTYVRRILPYRTERGVVDGICLTFIDVSPQKRAVRSKETAARFSAEVFATVRTPLLILDRELRILSANRSFATVFDTGDELVGRRLAEVLGDDSALEAALAPLIQAGTDVDDLELERGGRTILLTGRRIHVDSEEDRVALSFEDVTARRLSAEQAQRRAAELADDARRKDEWIAMLGHELRNPLGAVLNGIEQLNSMILSAPEKQVVGMIGRQGEQVRRLLDDLLDAARMVAGRLHFESEPVDLTAVAQWAVESTQRLASAKQQTLTVELPPPGSLWVRGDAARLVEVVSNLLTNAVKYTDPEGRISLEVQAAGDSAVIQVRDNGSGIPEDLISGIFELFTQGPRSLDRSQRGLGLGLAIVRTFVGLHGGEVEASSPGAGLGSEFRVTLPRMQPASSQGTAPPSKGKASPTRGKRILIVDDETDGAESLAYLLRSCGHDTRTASSGPAALGTAAAFAPDVALLDLGLPGMDGFELAQRLRRGLPSCRLIAVTGYQRVKRGLEDECFDAHLLKPVDLKRLMGLLGEAP